MLTLASVVNWMLLEVYWTIEFLHKMDKPKSPKKHSAIVYFIVNTTINFVKPTCLNSFRITANLVKSRLDDPDYL